MRSIDSVHEDQRKTSEQKIHLSLFGRVGRFSVRYRWWILAASLVFAVIAAIGSAGITSRLDAGGFDVPGSESFRTSTMLNEQFHTGDYNMLLLVTAKQGTVDDPAIVSAGKALTQELATQAGVAEATSYWTRESAPTLRSHDSTQALVLARVSGNTTQARDRIGALTPFFTREHAQFSVGVGGDDGVLEQSGTQSQRDLIRAESISLPILLLLLFFVFRSPLAALLPLMMSLLAIAGTLLTLRIVVSFTQVSNFTLNMATSLGLGLGIDYSLLIVSRFREELYEGRAVQYAAVRAVETAGRIIAFSALIFSVALSALLISSNFFLRSFAYAGMAVIVMSAACALLVLPASLSILGRRIDSLMIGRQHRAALGTGFWHRAAMFVMRRPIPISIAVVALLIILGTPFLHINFGIVDDRILPPGASSRQVQEQIRSNFSADEAHDIHVVASGITPATQRAAIERYAIALSRIPGVVQVNAFTGSYADGKKTGLTVDGSSRFVAEQGTWLSVIPSQAVVAKDAYGIVRAVRAVPAPFPVAVGGHLAQFLDLQDSVLEQAPLIVGTVILTTLVLFFLMSGSLLLPLKAIMLNFLSLSAAFGAIVWIFQDGHLSDLLGFTATGGLDVRTVVLMFCFAFGLSMDYEMFIIGRIKEEYDRTGDNIHSVAMGMERSGPLITAAAGLLAIVFAAVGTSEVVLFKMLGVGMTLIVLMDATLIRALLVPAFLRLMGQANWWVPPALQRLQQRIGLSESETA